MESIEAKFEPNPIKKMQKYSLAAQVGLRMMTIVGTLAAAWMIFTSKQTSEVYGITVDARYSYSPAFKFLAFANAIACAFTMLSIILAFLIHHQGSKPINFFFLFLHDLLVMSLVLAGCAAATAIGYLGRYGNSHAGWMPICDHFGKFCNRVSISVILSYLALFFLLMLTVISANKSRQIPV